MSVVSRYHPGPATHLYAAIVDLRKWPSMYREGKKSKGGSDESKERVELEQTDSVSFGDSCFRSIFLLVTLSLPLALLGWYGS